MIILIISASHTGKTVLAQKLLEKYNYPYLSIDHLKMGLIRSGNTMLTPVSDDNLLTNYLWPIVCEMVKTAIENNQNLIVEGCYIPLSWKNDFDKEYLNKIKFYCLVMSDGYIKNISLISRNTPAPSKPVCMRKIVRRNLYAGTMHGFLNNVSCIKQTIF